MSCKVTIVQIKIGMRYLIVFFSPKLSTLSVLGTYRVMLAKLLYTAETGTI